MIEMEIGGLGFDPRSMSPIVLLRDKEERNFLPIWIGMFEAAAIAMEIQKFSPPRPMTHDLLRDLINKLGAEVYRVIINDIRNNTFYALVELKMRSGKKGSAEEKSAPADKTASTTATVTAASPAPAASTTVTAPTDSPSLPEGLIGLDCRPSDALALAVRAGAPIYVTETVMMQAKMVNAEKDAEETKKFKEFVQNLNPDDFSKYYGSHG